MKQSSMQENYEHILMNKQEREFVQQGGKLQTRKMNKNEESWARSFERYERALNRGRLDRAIDAFKDLKGEPTNAQIARMKQEILIRRNANPTFTESKAKYDKKINKGIRKPKSNLYDASDWVEYETQWSINEETGEGQESEVSVVIDPQDYLIEAINESQVKKCSLERLVEDYKLSKIAKADLLARTQKMTYEAMTYTFHGTQYMNLNYILKGVNGQLYVQDQHDRIQSMELYLKRQTSDSFATHAEVWYPNQTGETWIFQPGPKSNIEGKAVKYEVP